MREAAGVLLTFSKLILAHISGGGGKSARASFFASRSSLCDCRDVGTATIGKKVATFFLLMGGHSNERRRVIKINENQSMSGVWFTADFHFGHFNIIRYCNRPFANTQEMDEAICERVNACAKPNDTLYFLGDFCLGGPDRVTAYRKRLACRTIHFIEGNHDKTARKLQHLFASWNLLSEIHAAKQRIVLCHYAMRVWPHHAQGAWHLYGHSHGNLPDEPLALSLDVGVDTHEFRPWHFDEIQSVMQAKAKVRESANQADRRAALADLAAYDQEIGI